VTLLVLNSKQYINNSEDWSSFSSSLGLTMTYVGALIQMLQARQREEFDPKELSYAGIAMDALPVMCVSIVVAIMDLLTVDCGIFSEGSEVRVNFVVATQAHRRRRCCQLRS